MATPTDPWQAEFDRQITSAAKALWVATAVNAVICAFLYAYGIIFDVLAVVMGVVVFACTFGSIVCARGGRARPITPLLVLAAFASGPLGFSLVVLSGRLHAAALGLVSPAPPALPLARSGKGRLIVHAPAAMFDRSQSGAFVTVDDQAHRLSFTPYVVDVTAGEHEILFGDRASVKVAVEPGRAAVVIGIQRRWGMLFEVMVLQYG